MISFHHYAHMAALDWRAEARVDRTSDRTTNSGNNHIIVKERALEYISTEDYHNICCECFDMDINQCHVRDWGGRCGQRHKSLRVGLTPERRVSYRQHSIS